MRRQKKYHYIYRTTCQVTNKFYVGMHSTDNLEDGYLGSGKILGYSRKKHGDENHIKEILEMCSDRKALKLREKEIVNEELLADPLNMNLRYGGEGGGGWTNAQQSINGLKGRIKMQLLRETNPEWIAQNAKAISVGNKKAYANGLREPMMPSWSGRQHNEETKQKIGRKNSVAQQGDRNSQFGTCWVYNEKGSKKIKIKDLAEYIKKGFIRGRKHA